LRQYSFAARFTITSAQAATNNHSAGDASGTGSVEKLLVRTTVCARNPASVSAATASRRPSKRRFSPTTSSPNAAR
jgi:hypothetical protein